MEKEGEEDSKKGEETMETVETDELFAGLTSTSED